MGSSIRSPEGKNAAGSRSSLLLYIVELSPTHASVRAQSLSYLVFAYEVGCLFVPRAGEKIRVLQQPTTAIFSATKFSYSRPTLFVIILKVFLRGKLSGVVPARSFRDPPISFSGLPTAHLPSKVRPCNSLVDFFSLLHSTALLKQFDFLAVVGVSVICCSLSKG